VRISFLTGSRGEWGYIRPILRLCKEREIDYRLCVTNMHLLPSYGTTINEIRADGFDVDDEILMALDGDSHHSMTKSLAVFMASFADVLRRVKPDWLVLAGDRGEQLMGAIAAAYTYTPVAHIQAGERSGNIDGIARHAIGKFVHLHFAANEDARQRLVRLGEQDFRIHNVGAPQLDDLVAGDVTPREKLESNYSIDLSVPYLLVAQHPVTEEYALAETQIRETLEAVNRFDMPKIWILPNNDAGSHYVRETLLHHRKGETFLFKNLKREDYLGFLKGAACIAGNSSSGLLEAPTFKVPAVNLGRRQESRVRGDNVIDADFTAASIEAAIRKALSPEFQRRMQTVVNPYGDGRSSERILDILQHTRKDQRLLVKELTY
jgi:GDP/UDP-N,N'-diacetylbacillosamine 2-epimerase (hydrolysing)